MQLRIAAAGLAVALVAATASADDAADLATARAEGIEGITLADAGNCREAIEKLTRAEALHHAPTTAVRLAECEIEVGKLVSGTERLNRVVREPLGPSPSAPFVAAAARAQRDLDAALPRVATLRITTPVPPGAKLAVAIDGEPAPVAIVNGIRQIDPGRHRVELSAPGYRTAVADATLEEGRATNVTLTLERDPNASADASEAGASAADGSGGGGGAAGARGAEGDGRSSVGSIAAFGVAALGLGVGVVGAVMTAEKSATLEESCGPSKACPESSAADLRTAKTWATVSTVGFVGAGVGALVGVALLVTGHSPSARTAATARPRGVRPTVGFGTVGVGGNF